MISGFKCKVDQSGGYVMVMASTLESAIKLLEKNGMQYLGEHPGFK